MNYKDKKELSLSMIKEGKNYKDICKELGISKSTYYLWKKDLYIIKEKSGPKSVTYDIYRRVVDDCNKYKVQLDILHECKCSFMTIPEKEKIVESLEHKYKVADLCAALDLNKATYYNYKFRRITEPEVETHHEKIKDAFIEAYIETKGRLGSEKMVAYLRKRGVRTSQRKITQLMKETGMLNNQMKQKSQVRQNVEFLLKCFNNALQNRNHPKLMGFHSDQGTIYKSYEFRKTLESKNIQQSFSMKGNPYDNSVV